MRFHILTIFPEYFDSPLRVGLLGKAIKKGLIQIYIHQLRDFAMDKHKVVDDKPYGGGEGMVFKPEPLYRAIVSIKERDPEAKVVYLSPQGKLFHHHLALKLSQERSLLLLCGRYEGIDERIKESLVDEEISIGDYVVFGGEVATLVLIEAISRLIPGVVGKKDSVEKESFSGHLLKYPCYTRPAHFMGMKVPNVLLSGNHSQIEKYRRELSLKITLEKRPELLNKAPLDKEDLKTLKNYLTQQKIYIFLVHYPVYNKRKEIIASAIANIDLHDLSRLARTYGIERVYIIQPIEEQRIFGKTLIEHWIKGGGREYNPLRSEALSLLKIVSNIEEAIEEIRQKEGMRPVLIGTDAKAKRSYLTPEEVRSLLFEKPIVLVFGTAWGLEENFLHQCDYFLEPIWGRLDEYNHLSVRSAASILLDRILRPYLLFKKTS